MMSTIFGI